MPTGRDTTPWGTHDWKVKTLESLTAGGGSRLGFTCRSCGRKFNYTTVNHRAWAVNDEGLSLAERVTSRWLSEQCPGGREETDDDDRLVLRNPR